jgi:hypothetical protein
LKRIFPQLMSRGSPYPRKLTLASVRMAHPMEMAA